MQGVNYLYLNLATMKEALELFLNEKVLSINVIVKDLKPRNTNDFVGYDITFEEVKSETKMGES